MSVLDGFVELVVPRTYSIAEVRILKNRISFNRSTASELGYPPFVKLMVSADRTQLAIKPCEKHERNAMEFFTKKSTGEKCRSIAVGNKALTSLVKSGLGWSMDVTMSAPGVRLEEENVILFDLTQAVSSTKKNESFGLCVVPTPAFPFASVPPEYFGYTKSKQPEVIEVEWEESVC